MARQRPKLAQLLSGIGVGLAVALVLMLVARTDAWQSIESRSLGAVLSRDAAPPMNERVLLVGIDDAALRRLDQMIYRRQHAQVLELLHQAGAKVVAYDIFFASAGRDGLEGNQAFAAAAIRFGRAVAPLECSEDRDAAELPPAHEGMLSPGATPAFPCRYPILPHGPLRAMRPAHPQLPLTGSGHARGVYPLAEVGSKRVPVLGLAAYLAAEGLGDADVQQLPEAILLPGRRIQLTREASALVSHRALPREAEIVNFADLVEAAERGLSQELRKRIEGAYVVVGLTSKSAGDFIELPTGEHVPAVVMHLAFLSDLIEGRSVSEVPPLLASLSVLALALLLSLAAGFLRPARLVALLVIATFAVLYLVRFLIARDLWVGPLAPIVGCWGGAGAALAIRLLREEAQRRTLEVAFRSYVDGNVLERILRDPDKFLSLGGARKRLTILFSDIQGYTSMSNTMPTDSVLGFLKDYLQVMTGIVMSGGGRIDKIMGDGIMAVFGDPVPSQLPARDGVDVALAMQAAVVAHQAEWQARWGISTRIRIGLATGEVFVGNIGGAKIEYTVIGPSVNLAARLESASPAGKVAVCEETRRECGDDYEVTRLEGLTLKGFEGAQHAYVVHALKPKARAA